MTLTTYTGGVDYLSIVVENDISPLMALDILHKYTPMETFEVSYLTKELISITCTEYQFALIIQTDTPSGWLTLEEGLGILFRDQF